ncbi:MFS transporter [Desulfospira joergensenii]|uniref:MFS transporter n=1 Tax=Desulfospira joergensenii TaxID=53329 RepID=UPI0003B6D317|nr:MFS transporter [Desulfospira joergensenii]
MTKEAAGTCEPNPLGFEMAKWSIFFILILTYILVYFHRMAPGVVSEFLMAEFKTTGTRLGTLSAIYFFVYACMQIPSGVIADTLGTRTSVVSGNLVAGIGSIVFGMAGSFEMACAGRFLVGLGVSVVFVSIMKNNSVWFHERVFGLMSGLTLLFGNLGSVLAAGPLSSLLTFFEWRMVFMGIGCLSLGLAFLGFLMVRNRPEDMGFAPPNLYSDQNKTQPRPGNWIKNLGSVIMVLRIWPGFWVQFGMIGGLYSFMGLWGIPYLRDVHGLTRGTAADHMTVMLLSFAVGALFFGWFSDRMGLRKPILIASVALYSLSWILLMYTSWSPGLPGYLLFGFMGFAGSGFVLTFACAKEIIHPELSGMAVSVVNTGCFIGTALMQPLFGYLADQTWAGTLENGVRIYAASDYHNGFIAMFIFALLALAASFRVRETHCRNVCV